MVMSHAFLARSGGEEDEQTRRTLARAGRMESSIPVHDSEVQLCSDLWPGMGKRGCVDISNAFFGRS